MGALKDANRDDLKNLFPNHDFNEVAAGDHTRVDFEHNDTIDSVTNPGSLARFNFAGGPTLTIGQQVRNTTFTTNPIYNGTHIVFDTDGTTWFEVAGILFGANESGSMAARIASAQREIVDDAYERIRDNLVDGGRILIGDVRFQGSTKFGGDATIPPEGAVDVRGDSAATARIRTVRYQNSVNGAGAVQVGHSRGSEGSPSALLSGDRLRQYIFLGDDSVTEHGAGPVMRAFTTENWSGSAKGSKITVETIKPGATAETLAMTFSEHGYPEAPTYTVATLPNVGVGGGTIHVSDETGGAVNAFSDGTNWRRCTDRAIVA